MYPSIRRKVHADPFVPGLLDVLGRSATFNLTIVKDMAALSKLSNLSSSSSSSSSPSSFLMLVARPKTSGGYEVNARQDAPSLRTTVLSVLAAAAPKLSLGAAAAAASQQEKNQQVARQAVSALETKSCHAYSTSHGNGGSSGGFPRITILNRISTRRIVNVDKLKSAIVGLLKKNDTNTTTTTVRVEHFEGRSFAEQVTIMANADIVVSPHGAQQLTSIPFMKSQPCGAVLELFFPTGYWFPHYFGSLAAASGVNQHVCIYLGNPAHRDNEVKIGSKTCFASPCKVEASKC
jgi:Glycosyltransferase 61